jgi:hypothetical protein
VEICNRSGGVEVVETQYLVCCGRRGVSRVENCLDLGVGGEWFDAAGEDASL